MYNPRFVPNLPLCIVKRDHKTWLCVCFFFRFFAHTFSVVSDRVLDCFLFRTVQFFFFLLLIRFTFTSQFRKTYTAEPCSYLKTANISIIKANRKETKNTSRSSRGVVHRGIKKEKQRNRPNRPRFRRALILRSSKRARLPYRFEQLVREKPVKGVFKMPIGSSRVSIRSY